MSERHYYAHGSVMTTSLSMALDVLGQRAARCRRGLPQALEGLTLLARVAVTAQTQKQVVITTRLKMSPNSALS